MTEITELTGVHFYRGNEIRAVVLKLQHHAGQGQYLHIEVSRLPGLDDDTEEELISRQTFELQDLWGPAEAAIYDHARELGDWSGGDSVTYGTQVGALLSMKPEHLINLVDTAPTTLEFGAEDWTLKARAGFTGQAELHSPNGLYYRFPATVLEELLQDRLGNLLNQVQDLKEANQALVDLLWTPENEDFLKGVMREAGHQVHRWGTDHDAGKTPVEWFWLLAHLATKACVHASEGSVEKAKHHTISTAAVLANWHAHLSGTQTLFRPGLGPDADGPKPAAQEGRA